MKKKIFINYSWTHDKKSAKKIYATLAKFSRKFDVWMDSESMQGGLQWRPAIFKAIREANIFIAILSPGSVNKIGTINEELYEAMAMYKKFPPNQIYLVPTRVKACTSPFQEMAKFNYVDLFPSWNKGMAKLLYTLDPSFSIKKPVVKKKEDSLMELVSLKLAKPKMLKSSKPARPKYHYRVGLFDIDLGISHDTLKKIIAQLNKIQHYFLFTLPEMSPVRNKLQTIQGIRNFNVSKVTSKYIKANLHLETDLVACITKYPLAFEEDNKLLSNFFAGPSDHDERFMFISADHLKEFSLKAGTKPEEGLVYMLTGQLISYFTKLDYHAATRGCVMDFCNTRADIVKGFQKPRLCPSCDKKFPEGDHKVAIQSLLNWKFK